MRKQQQPIHQICKELATAAWTEAWDDAAQTAYMYNDTKWVSYDDHRSIAVKARYAFDQQLAGVMVWAIDNDDFDAGIRSEGEIDDTQ